MTSFERGGDANQAVDQGQATADGHAGLRDYPWQLRGGHDVFAGDHDPAKAFPEDDSVDHRHQHKRKYISQLTSPRSQLLDEERNADVFAPTDCDCGPDGADVDEKDGGGFVGANDARIEDVAQHNQHHDQGEHEQQARGDETLKQTGEPAFNFF